MLARVATLLIEAAFQNFRGVVATISAFSLWCCAVWAGWLVRGMAPPATALLTLPLVLLITPPLYGIERRPPPWIGTTRFGNAVRVGVRLWVGCSFASLFAVAIFVTISALWLLAQASLDTLAVQAGTTTAGGLGTSTGLVGLPFRILATAAMTLAALAIGYGYTAGQRRVQVSRLTLPLRFFPTDLEGLRVVHVSDLHIGPYLDAEQLSRYVHSVNALFPDLIVITGDIVDDRAADLDPALPILSTLRAAYGTVVILGNHDHRAGADAVAERIARATDFVLLRDGRFTITSPRGSRLHLVGIEDRGGAIVRGAGEERRLATLLAELPEQEPVILLAHRPELFESAARAGVALTLSGHTHGGQIALRLGTKRIISPGNLMSRFVHGLFECNGAYLYVNRGLGLVGQPVRVGAPREIGLLKLMAAVPRDARNADAA
jgi:predicted MPP superfamily phosphohydrolase